MDFKDIAIPAGAAAAVGLGFWWWKNKAEAATDAGYKPVPKGTNLGGAPVESFEVAEDGHLEIRKQDGVGIVAFLASQVVSPTGDPTVFMLTPTSDGKPIPVGSSAKEFALAGATAGFNVLVQPTIFVADSHDKAMKFAPDTSSAQPGKGWAVLIKGDPAGAKTLPAIPAMPGFDKTLTPTTTVDPVLKPASDPTATMPADLAAKVKDILAKEDADPVAVETLAVELGSSFPDASAALHKKAQDLRAKQVVKAVSMGAAFVLPPKAPGAVELAKRFTGDASRVRELLAHNPQLNVGSNGVAPWVPGQVIVVPPIWTARGAA